MTYIVINCAERDIREFETRSEAQESIQELLDIGYIDQIEDVVVIKAENPVFVRATTEKILKVSLHGL